VRFTPLILVALIVLVLATPSFGNVAEAQYSWIQMRWITQLPSLLNKSYVPPRSACVYDRYFVVMTVVYEHSSGNVYGYVVALDKETGAVIKNININNVRPEWCADIDGYLYVSFYNYTDRMWYSLVFDRNLNPVKTIRGIAAQLYDGTYLYFTDLHAYDSGWEVIKATKDGEIVSRVNTNLLGLFGGMTFTPRGDILYVGTDEEDYPSAVLIDRNSMSVKARSRLGYIKSRIDSVCTDQQGYAYVSMVSNDGYNYIVKLDQHPNVVKIVNVGLSSYSIVCIDRYIYALGFFGDIKIFDSDLNVVYTTKLDADLQAGRGFIVDGGSIYGVCWRTGFVDIAAVRFDTPFVAPRTYPSTSTPTTATQTEAAAMPIPTIDVRYIALIIGAMILGFVLGALITRRR